MTSKLYGWLARGIGSPRLVPGITLLAFLCTLPSLYMGLQADDYILREQVLEAGPFAAYQFQPLDPVTSRAELVEGRTTGRIAWWANENARTTFFRPLASLSLWLDFSLGLPPWWMHLENCALYALMVFLVITLYKQLGLSRTGLGWASVFFAIDSAFATPVGWISGRNTVMAACFGVAAVMFHDRARRFERPALLALAILCFAMSLFSAELGLCALGYLAAHALVIERGRLLSRITVLSPYIVLSSAYLAYYLVEGYGSHGVSGYRDVLSAPGAALVGFVESLPVWFASAATLPLATLQLLVPGARIPFLVAALLLCGLLIWVIAARWKELPSAKMLLLGAIFSLVPLATTVPQERLRFFLAVGAYGILGPWVALDFASEVRSRRVLARTIWHLHAVWLPILMFFPMLFAAASSPVSGGAVASLDRALPSAQVPIAILLNPPAWSVSSYLPAIRAWREEPVPPTFTLYAGVESLEITRQDDHSLDLHAPSGWYAMPFNAIGAPYSVGTRIDLSALTILVREVDDAGAPTRIRATFDHILEDPGISFWRWEGKELGRWSPPPIGQRVRLPMAAAF